MTIDNFPSALNISTGALIVGGWKTKSYLEDLPGDFVLKYLGIIRVKLSKLILGDWGPEALKMGD